MTRQGHYTRHGLKTAGDMMVEAYCIFIAPKKLICIKQQFFTLTNMYIGNTPNFKTFGCYYFYKSLKIYDKMELCFFVCLGFFSHSRIFHLH